MAINIKTILADTLLSLCLKYPLENITIKQILEASKISRQTFYNHFIDKNDLIQYIYNTKIIPDFSIGTDLPQFSTSLLATFKNMEKYHYFMKQACKMEGQNCLKDYIYHHCVDFDLKWHQKIYGSSPMPEALKFATIYHANASSSMTLSWILSDMPVSANEITEMIVKMRALGMDTLFKKGEVKENPYQ